MRGSTLIYKAVAEAIGTFTLVFAGCGGMMVSERFPGSLPAFAIPLIFGIAVMMMVYAAGHISGAHFNPAVTLAFSIARHFPAKQVPLYWLAQCAGAFLALFLLIMLLPEGKSFGATAPHIAYGQALGWEIVLTFFLMFVIISVATDTRAVGIMAGIAIGASVTLGAFIGGPLTGASMNPARSLAPAVFEHRLDALWIYIAGPMIGALLAAFLYEWIRNPKEHS